MRSNISTISIVVGLLGQSLLCGCMPPPRPNTHNPALEYADRIKEKYARTNPEYRAKLMQERSFESSQYNPMRNAMGDESRASLRLVSDGGNNAMAAQALADDSVRSAGQAQNADSAAFVTNLNGAAGVTNTATDYNVYESRKPMTRDYTGPLAFGDPGLSPSLWKESSSGTQLFRDYRAWQPMDLITILVAENSEGKNKADTTIKQESSVAAAITNFFGFEKWMGEHNKDVDLKKLIGADSSHDYKGEGETKRTGTLKATISAMVAEVLPSGVLRIEGEKIITVNNDDEVMKISGLVRPEDVNSNNEVDSSKVANVRIDYFGKGSVGDAQTGGWLGNLIRRLWPL